MRVAWIDDAVNLDFIQCIGNQNVRIAGTYTVEGGEVRAQQTKTEKITHGSVCAGIFVSEVRCRCELLFIQVLDTDSLRGNIHNLAAALEFCAKSQINVVNLSLGTTRIRDAGLLQDAIHKLVQAHVVVVAAASNRNLLTFPAALEHVVGVCELTAANRKYPSDCILYKSTKRIFRYRDMSVMTGGYNSYAAAAVTADVCDPISRGVTQAEEIKYDLIRKKAAKKSKKRKRSKIVKPILFVCVRGAEEAAREIKHILRFFYGHEYEGICISDALPTDLCSGILNLSDFMRGVPKINHRLGLLTNAADADFVIWHVPASMIGMMERKSIDITVTDRAGDRRMPGHRVLTGPLDEEKLGVLLRCLT